MSDGLDPIGAKAAAETVKQMVDTALGLIDGTSLTASGDHRFRRLPAHPTERSTWKWAVPLG